jgi:hypothetical protein
MEIFVLLVIQLVATFAGLGLLWRRLDTISADLARLHVLMESFAFGRTHSPARRGAPAPREVRPAPVMAEAESPSVADAPPAPPPSDGLSNDPFDDAWVRPSARSARAGDAIPAQRQAPSARLVAVDEDVQSGWREMSTQLSPDTVRGFACLALLAVPAIGFAFSLPPIAIVLGGLFVVTATVLASMRFGWVAPVWAAAVGAGSWALVGLEVGITAGDASLFAGALSVAALAGLAEARAQRRSWSGGTLALFMAAAALAFGAANTLVGPAGLAYGAIVALAAILGASRLRRDAFHLAAFAAAGIGLYALSGHADAAIWFTPAAAWVGALFLAIAALRVPPLGARGGLLAATGVVAALFAAGSLYASQHGLANPIAAAGAFAGLAAIFSGILALAVRRAGVVGDLRLTAWVLVAATTSAAASAIFIALSPPFAATALAACALILVSVDDRFPDQVWRFFSVAITVAACVAATLAARSIGGLLLAQDLLLTIGFGLALPAAITGGAAFVAAKRAPITSALLEIAAITGGIVAIAALTRFVLSGGAPAVQPLSFVECGVHAAIWLGAALLLAARADDGAADVRRAAATLLVGAALATCALAGALWLTPFWNARTEAGLPWLVLRHVPLGFLAPALLAWAHWLYWRQARAPRRAHFALAIAGVLTALFVLFEFAWRDGGGALWRWDWISYAAGALALSVAIAVHFAPGVVLRPRDLRQLDLDEYLKRHGRSQQAG